MHCAQCGLVTLLKGNFIAYQQSYCHHQHHLIYTYPIVHIIITIRKNSSTIKNNKFFLFKNTNYAIPEGNEINLMAMRLWQSSTLDVVFSCS